MATTKTSLFHWISALLMVSLVWFLPIALGGVTTIGLVLLLIISPLVVAFSLASYVTNSHVSGDRSSTFLALWCVGSVCILVDPLLDWLQWRTPYALSDIDETYLVNLSLGRSISYWSHFCAYIGIAWATHRLPLRQCVLVISAILAMAVFQNFYGLAALATNAETIFNTWQRSSAIAATGSFYNSNHFAGYLELVLPMVLGFCLHWHDRVAPSKRPLLYGLMIAGSIALVLGVMTSRSRLGLVGMFSGLTCFWVLNRISHEKKTGSTLLITAGVVLSLAMTLWFGLSSMLEKWFILFERGNARWDVWMSTLEFPNSWWFVGIGPGRFVDYFPLVQGFQSNVHFYHLHNDVLQFFLEFGLLRAIIMIGVIVMFLLPQITLGKSYIKTAAFAGIVAILIHSMGDFNLQIRGVAVVFWIMVGLLLNDNLSAPDSKRRRGLSSDPSPNGSPPAARVRVKIRESRRSSNRRQPQKVDDTIAA